MKRLLKLVANELDDVPGFLISLHIHEFKPFLVLQQLIRHLLANVLSGVVSQSRVGIFGKHI